ncbi:MAG: M23 family peptidase [Verrucomicrobia bacterium]|nr:MAG: M23 family peptidase [Verrucomicrobiota bacterium]
MRCACAPVAVVCAVLSALICGGATSIASAETADTTAASIVDLALPTDNDALFRGGGPEFYQYIERDYHGVKSTPWEGGQYGFVRDPMQTGAGLVYTRFHEGIDIRPLQRDERGEPLDEVRAIADGKVVYTNRVPSHSNYGNYIVIEHRWDSCNYYSLYGHLSTIAVQPGQVVQRRERIARMGYTGTGINLSRAHVHLELNLLLSHNFQSWYDTFHKEEPNYHGIYNGINLKGLDIARLYLALRRNPSLIIPEFLADEDTFYKVTLPRSPHFELPKLYPWMLRGNSTRGAKSWEVSFTRSGLPLRIEPSTQRVRRPQLSYVQKSSLNYSDLTQGELSGRGNNVRLSKDGEAFMRLLIWPD